MIFDLASYSPAEIYHLMTQTVVPRPIAWVLSENEDKTLNLAPFSYFTAISSDPALIAFSVGKKDKNNEKDTKVNILAGREFVVHIPSKESAEAVSKSAAALDYGQSELEIMDEVLVEFPGSTLKRLDSAPVAMLCSFFDSHELGEGGGQTVIYGLIKSIFVADSAVEVSGKRISIDPEGIQPLSRLGGANYAELGQLIEVKRPK